MAMRHDYFCESDGYFTMWSDEGLFCPKCGSKDIKKMILSAPSISTTGMRKTTDQLIQNQLDSMGLSNFNNRYGETKVTRKSTMESLQAEKLERDFPALKDFKPQTTAMSPNGYNEIIKAVTKKYLDMGVKGVLKSGIGNDSQAPVIKALIKNSGQIQPLSKRTEKYYSADKDNEGKMLQEMVKKA